MGLQSDTVPGQIWDGLHDLLPCKMMYGTNMANNFRVFVGETIFLLLDPFGRLLDLRHSGVAKVLFNALATACASSGQWRESLLVCSEAGSGCHQIRGLI